MQAYDVSISYFCRGRSYAPLPNPKSKSLLDFRSSAELQRQCSSGDGCGLRFWTGSSLDPSHLFQVYMTFPQIPIEASAGPLCICSPHHSFRVRKIDLWNPGASGANSSSSAQPQRQHVVSGDRNPYILQRGKTGGGAGSGALAITPIPVVGFPELLELSDMSHRRKNASYFGIQLLCQRSK